MAGALLSACGSSGATLRSPAAGPGAPTPAEDRAHAAAFAQVEDEVMGWMAAADPRLAARENASAPPRVLEQVGMEAMMVEDTAAVIRGSSLDLFAFRARAHTLDEGAKVLAAFEGPVPEKGPFGSALARPRLERELLDRFLGEERARADEEAKLGDASGDLLRTVASTWTPPAKPHDVQERDIWMQKHLLELRDSLRDPARWAGPTDLETALTPLERLMAPMQYPRGTAALAEVLIVLGADMRAVPKLVDSGRVAHAVKVHLGVDLETATLPARLQHLEMRLREAAEEALKKTPPEARRDIEGKARGLLLVEGPCPPVTETRVRAMTPPPERAALCGAVRALTEETTPAAVMALHDDVLLAFAAVVPAPPPRTGLLSHPDNDDVERLQRMARERPVPVLGVALAAEILYPEDGPGERLNAWRALGEAPLDVVRRELAPVSAGGRPPGVPRRACPPPCTSAP